MLKARISRVLEALAAVRAHDAGTKMPNSEQYENAAASAPQLDAEDSAEPVEDVVDEMIVAFSTHRKGHGERGGMIAALAVARKGYVKLKDALGPTPPTSHAAESTAQLNAEDHHPRYGTWEGFAGSQVRVDPSMPIDEIRVEHPSGRVDRIVNVAPAAEPVEDVVSRMCKAFGKNGISPYIWRDEMTAAFVEARKGYYSLEDAEKAIRDLWMDWQKSAGPIWDEDRFIVEFRARLAPKPSPEERVTIVRWLHDPSRWIVLRDGWNPGNHDGFKDRKDAERYAAGLRLELAAPVERRTK